MATVRRTKASWKDYHEIWKHIASQGRPDAADALLREFDANLLLLAEHPRIGPTRYELRQRMRSLPVGNYILFYRPIRNGIELMRIVHGARNLRKIFKR